MRGNNYLAAVGVLVLIMSFVQVAHAELATPQEMETVCRSWLEYIVHETGGWAGEAEPKIVDAQDIVVDGITLGRCFTIAPDGFVVVPALKELPPIKAYSEKGRLDAGESEGFPRLLREVLQHRVDVFLRRYGSLDAAQPRAGEVLFDPANRREWDRYAADREIFKANLDRGAFAPLAGVGPLLTTRWHQADPYNDDCPLGDGGRAVVGCTATAVAQLINYHAWPPTGVGDHSYYWEGDWSCGGSSPSSILSADFSDAFDWANMADHCEGGCYPAQEAALAELCHEVGVAFEMEYGVCASGAGTDIAQIILPRHFRYAADIEFLRRSNYSADQWFDLIQAEVNAHRPMLYTITLHAIVCDGWRDTTGMNQVHMNYGWGGSQTHWYAIDGLYCEWSGCDPMAEDLQRNIRPMPATDCNDNSILDQQDIWDGTSSDCNANAMPDECDIADEVSSDCQVDGIPDECQITDVVAPSGSFLCSNTAANGLPWCESFESYPTGSIQGMGGWQGWGPGSGDPFYAGSVSTERNHTPGGSKSLEIVYHDTVHVFDGYDGSKSPYWMLGTRVFVSSSTYGNGWFIIMADYDGAAGNTYALALEMDTDVNMIRNTDTFAALPLVFDEWAEIRLAINFERDVVSIYYNDVLLGKQKWSLGGGMDNIGAIDLWSPFSSGYYFDDLYLYPALSVDCNDNNHPDECDEGDFDGDGVVDLTDYVGLADCLTGPCASALCPTTLYDRCCSIADFDFDGDFDLVDLAAFQVTFSDP
ncbi:MAG: C10 family peptidase [Phycisphaerales bacterium]|nr:MAG: C10 family peptidase [Phycisphaerales bacterium]